MEMDRETVAILQTLYNNEINFRISCFWDAGFRIEIGDEINGFKASDDHHYGINNAVDALWALARGIYPDLILHGND